jgi:glutathione S-transferase
MRTLHHVVLSPFCRKIRLQLAEKKIPFALELERPWERRAAFLTLSPTGEVPVLREENGNVLCDSMAISEYLEEANPDATLMPKDPLARAEVRRLIAWFDHKFHREVTEKLIPEKVYKRFGWSRDGATAPDMSRIREGLDAIKTHMAYLGSLADRKGWLTGELSLADFAAAAHISCIDYVGDVPWSVSAPAKDWYMRIKSRPCFRPVLADRLPGMPPPPHYANLDF